MQRNYVYKRNKKRFKLNLRRIFLLLIFICTFFSGVMLKKVENIDNKDEKYNFCNSYSSVRGNFMDYSK